MYKSAQRLLNCILAVQLQPLFDFIVNSLKPKHGKIQYFKGNEIKTKRYQFSSSKSLCQKKPGPKLQLRLEHEVLLVLTYIRQDSPTEDLAFQFKASAGYASKIKTTITIFLAR